METTKYHWLQGRQVWTFSRLFNENPAREELFKVAQDGFRFMSKAKMADGKLYFSTSKEGVGLHYQRKPYAAVFYSMGLLEFSKALQKYNSMYQKVSDISPKDILDEAKLYFDKLREWMQDPTLIGMDSQNDIPRHFLSPEVISVRCLGGA